MVDPTKININQLPKKFCDGAIGSFSKDMFAFALTSGNNLDSFATTPQVMNEQIKNYENVHGEIDMTPPKIQSPMQISDIGEK